MEESKSKVIIHQRIPSHGGRMDITQKEVQDMHNGIKSVLPEDYIVISTPTDISVVAGDAKIITIDAKEYSYDELKSIIDSQSEDSGAGK